MNKFYFRINSLILITAMLMSLVPTVALAAPIVGDGSYEDPYEINNCAELESLDSSLGGFYEITGDIDCSASVDWNEGAGFNPIDYFGTDSVLLGNGHTITGLTINRPLETNVGLFANLYGSIVDLHFEDVDIIGSNEVGIVGRVSSNGSVVDVTVSGAIAGENYVGGIFGFMNYGSILKSSVSDITIDSNGSAGGLIGSLYYGGSVTDSYADAIISGDTVGGIIGYVEGNNDEILRVWSAGQLTGDSAVGGIVGKFQNSNMTVTNSFVAAEFFGEGYFGGIAGITDGGLSYVQANTTYFDEQFVSLCVGHVFDGTFDGDDCYSWDSVEDATYLRNNIVDSPIDTWDFDLVWTTTMGFPALSGSATYSVPSAPLNLNIVELDPNQFEITWDEPEDLGGLPLIEYNIQVDMEGEDFEFPLADYGMNDTSYTFYNNFLGQDLTLRVYASNLLGNGESTEEDFTGSENDVNEISTCEELQDIDEHSEYDSFVLQNDIDCTGFNFTPLGGEWSFRGLFDGQGYSIINLNVNTESEYAGLFKYIHNGVVRDVVFETPTITSTNGRVGVLTGYIEDGLISNVDVTGGSVVGTDSVGGLIGMVDSDDYIKILDSSFEGSVSGDQDVGGIVGYVDGDYAGTVAMARNKSAGTVSAIDYRAGGLVGQVYGYGDDDEFYFYLVESFSSADADAGYSAGGLIGEMYAEAYDDVIMLVRDSYATGNMTADYNAGGIVGFAESYYDDDDAEIEFNRVYASGSVTAGEGAGGLVGYIEAPDRSGEIVKLYNSFATGAVSSETNAGGLIGNLTNGLEQGDEENLYYADSTMQEVCDTEEYLETCEQTTLANLYDYENEPYASGNWDYEGLWYFTGDALPVFYWDDTEPEPEPEEEIPQRGRSTTGSRVAAKTETKNSEGGTPYAAEVAEVIAKEIVTEQPENGTNKCEALVMMSRVFGWEVPAATSSKYADVPEWCVSVAAYGTERGIVEGRTATTLGMETPVTRNELAVMLYRELKLQNYEFKGTTEVKFTDTLTPWAKEAVEALSKEGIINGFVDGTFGGSKNILKQDLGVMLMRIIN